MRRAGNGNVWSMLAGDNELGHVYLPTGTVTNDYYGVDRLGDNLFSDSIIAVDVKTGHGSTKWKSAGPSRCRYGGGRSRLRRYPHHHAQLRRRYRGSYSRSLLGHRDYRSTHCTPAKMVAALTPRFSPAVPAFEMW